MGVNGKVIVKFASKIDLIVSGLQNLQARIESNPAESKDVDIASIVLQHYQYCHQIIRDYWSDRNRIFIYILMAIAVGLILSTTVEGTTAAVALLGAFLAKTAGAENLNANTFISTDLVRALIPLPIFYLVFNLYQRDIYIRREHFYMQALEDLIRERLGVENSEAFTKEGAFYTSKQTFAQAKALLFYHLIVFLLLSIFYSYRIGINVNLVCRDFSLGNVLVMAIDLCLAAATGFYSSAYNCAPHAIVDRGPACKRNEINCMWKWGISMFVVILLGSASVFLTLEKNVADKIPNYRYFDFAHYEVSTS